MDATRKVDIRAFDRAIADAVDDGVDILNVSTGIFQPGCSGHCPHCIAIKQALDAGVIVVAAAGNVGEGFQGDTSETVFCPATRGDVIAAGGCVVECTAADETDLSKISTTPPSPYFAFDKPSIPGSYATGVYCGEQGCGEGLSCSQNKRISRWRGTPHRSNGKPDILAPVQCPDRVKGQLRLQYGTSYSTPIVAGGIASAIAHVFEPDEPIPTPYRVRNIVKRSGDPVAGAEEGMLNVERLKEQMRNHLNETHQEN